MLTVKDLPNLSGKKVIVTFTVIGIALLIIGATKIGSAPSGVEHTIGFNDPFNIGVMLLVLGGAILIYAIPAVIRFIEAKRKVVHE